jgi:hypothetical protein
MRQASLNKHARDLFRGYSSRCFGTISACVPKPESADDLFQAGALIRAHGMRFPSSISLSYKELHLAHKMLFYMRKARLGA